MQIAADRGSCVERKNTWSRFFACGHITSNATDAAKALGGHSQSLVKYHRIHPSILQTRSISLRSVRPESGRNQTSIRAAYGLPRSPS